MGKSENGIAVFAVLRREEFQKSGKQKLQNNRRLPCATCTYEQTCALRPFVYGHLSHLFVKCDIESTSEPSANGPLLVGQVEAFTIFKFLNPCSKTCRWQFDTLPLCLWIRLFSVNPMGFYCFLIRFCTCRRATARLVRVRLSPWWCSGGHDLVHCCHFRYLLSLIHI